MSEWDWSEDQIINEAHRLFTAETGYVFASPIHHFSCLVEAAAHDPAVRAQAANFRHLAVLSLDRQNADRGHECAELAAMYGMVA